MVASYPTRDCSSGILLTLEMPSPPEPLFTPPEPQTYSSQKAEEPDLRGKIRELDRRVRQRKLDDDAARRLELRRLEERAKEQLEAVRGEKSKLDSLATVEQGRESNIIKIGLPLVNPNSMTPL
jgi:hypothetical protein